MCEHERRWHNTRLEDVVKRQRPGVEVKIGELDARRLLKQCGLLQVLRVWNQSAYSAVFERDVSGYRSALEYFEPVVVEIRHLAERLDGHILW